MIFVKPNPGSRMTVGVWITFVRKPHTHFFLSPFINPFLSSVAGSQNSPGMRFSAEKDSILTTAQRSVIEPPQAVNHTIQMTKFMKKYRYRIVIVFGNVNYHTS